MVVCEYNSSTARWETTGVSKESYLEPYVNEFLDQLSDRFLINDDVEAQLLKSIPDILDVIPTDSDSSLIPCLDGMVISVQYPLVFRERTEEDYCSFEYQARFDPVYANRDLGLILFGSKYKKATAMLLSLFVEYSKEIIFRGVYANQLQEIVDPIFDGTYLADKFKFEPKAKRAKNTISIVSIPKDLDQCRFFSWLCYESQFFYETEAERQRRQKPEKDQCKSESSSEDDGQEADDGQQADDGQDGS